MPQSRSEPCHKSNRAGLGHAINPTRGMLDMKLCMTDKFWTCNVGPANDRDMQKSLRTSPTEATLATQHTCNIHATDIHVRHPVAVVGSTLSRCMQMNNSGQELRSHRLYIFLSAHTVLHEGKLQANFQKKGSQ